MAINRVIKKVYKEQVIATGISIGTGNGTATEFNLPNDLIIAGTLKVYIDGIETTDFTVDLTNGVITFTTAPGDTVAITADYTSSYDSTALTAAADTVILGMQVANVSSDIIPAVTVQVGDIRQCEGIAVPIRSSFSPITGKLVLVSGDVLRVSSDVNGVLELTLSYMEV